MEVSVDLFSWLVDLGKFPGITFGVNPFVSLLRFTEGIVFGLVSIDVVFNISRALALFASLRMKPL